MFIIKHPSRCFPSFVFVVVVTIAATISDQHVLTIHGFCVPAMVSSVYPLNFSHLQQHPTSSDQMLLDSATTNDVFANVSDVLVQITLVNDNRWYRSFLSSCTVLVHSTSSDAAFSTPGSEHCVPAGGVLFAVFCRRC